MVTRYVRPAEIAAPEFLRLNPDMTPWQTATEVATRGVGAEAGGYRSDPAREFFKNIVARRLLTPDGTVQSGEYHNLIRPIEEQFMRDTLGLSFESGNIGSVLSALGVPVASQAVQRQAAVGTPGIPGRTGGRDPGLEAASLGDLGGGVGRGDVGPGTEEGGAATSPSTGPGLGDLMDDLGISFQDVGGTLGSLAGPLGHLAGKAIGYGVDTLVGDDEEEPAPMLDPVGAAALANQQALAGTEGPEPSPSPGIGGPTATSPAGGTQAAGGFAPGTGRRAGSAIGTEQGSGDAGSGGHSIGATEGGSGLSVGPEGHMSQTDPDPEAFTDRGRSSRDDVGSGGGDAGSGGGGPSGAGGCFTAGTLIMMADGTGKAISAIKLGDTVMSFDRDGDLVPNQVTATFQHASEPVLLLNGKTRVTPVHRMLAKPKWFAESGRAAYEFLPMSELSVGDLLMDADGREVAIESIEPVGRANVFNLTVANNHTYLADNLRVHNSKMQGGYIDGDEGRPGQYEDREIEVMAGEYVLSQPVVNALGQRALDHINMALKDPNADVISVLKAAARLVPAQSGGDVAVTNGSNAVEDGMNGYRMNGNAEQALGRAFLEALNSSLRLAPGMDPVQALLGAAQMREKYKGQDGYGSGGMVHGTTSNTRRHYAAGGAVPIGSGTHFN